MATGAVAATTPTINAIRKASNLRTDLTKSSGSNRIAGGSGGTKFENGNMFLCTITEEVGAGVYKCLVQTDFTDPTITQTMTLTTYDQAFDRLYYPGDCVVACAFYLSSVVTT